MSAKIGLLDSEGAQETGERVRRFVEEAGLNWHRAPGPILLKLVGREVVRHVRRRWRLRRVAFVAERKIWASLLVALDLGPGRFYEGRRRGIGGLRMETALKQDLGLQPGAFAVEVGACGRFKPRAHALPGLEARHHRATWAYATCDSCGADEEEIGLYGGWTAVGPGRIRCRWCTRGTVHLPAGSVRPGPSFEMFRCDRCRTHLAAVAWSRRADGASVCAACLESSREAQPFECCDNCWRELPCTDGLCAECAAAYEEEDRLFEEPEPEPEPSPISAAGPVVFEVPF